MEISVDGGTARPMEKIKSLKKQLKVAKDYLPDIESKVVRMTWE
jgi:hypothetical protein